MFTRAAGCVTPVMGQILVERTSGLATFGTYAQSAVLAVVCSWLLPFEAPLVPSTASSRSRLMPGVECYTGSTPT